LRIIRLRRVLVVVVGALICVAGYLVVTSLSAGGGAGGSPARTHSVRPGSDGPLPTKTPDSPGISIAASSVYDIPDPFVVSYGGQYYMYMSSAFGDATNSNIPYIVGTPGHWSVIHEALPSEPSWAFSSSVAATTWDPFVARVGSRYVMYAAPSLRSDVLSRPMHCIMAAVADTPAGPFVPVGKSPLVCQTSLGGDIDAQLFYDPAGPRGRAHPYYLVWKSDNNNLPGSGPCTIWAAPMANDGLSLAGKAVAIFRPTQAWEEPVLEAPAMVIAPNGTDWMFFSSGTGYYTPRYDVGVVECSGILSGCFKYRAKPFITSNAQGPGPGEETVFVAHDGSMWLLYNPWHSRIRLAPLRPAEAVRVGWSSGGPYVAEAGQFPSPT
jgi:arabinan endo-1,5-alpha-L-arabinosidase